MEHASKIRSVRAPQGDGQTLIDPPLASLPEVVAQNRRSLEQVEYDVQGRSLKELSESARRALVGQALAHTKTYRDVPGRLANQGWKDNVPLVLSGHQPQLFHPGVWYKNFVLGSLARRLEGVGIHLLIDSDLCRSVSIRVPTGSARQPRLEAIPYDEPAPEVPYEERSIRDPETFASFSQRVRSVVRPLVSDPLIDSLWPLTVERSAQQPNLGLRLAQGRHALEAEWGNETLELPQSAVCQLPEFAWFVAHLLANLPRLWSAYNDALAAYRIAHRQRNRAHPVPDLDEVDGWLEAPFWIWSPDDPQRRPLFVRQSGEELFLSDRHAHTIPLNLSPDRDASAAAEQLRELSTRIKIRTRALTTTLFARLVLGDLFLHGIGGAKYDQVTDQIAESFFGFPLPDFAAVSATLRLPIASHRGELGARPTCSQQLRELRYHPEWFIERNGALSADDSAAARELVAKKRHWIEVAKTPENARERHQAINAANDALQPFVADRRQQIERQCLEYQERKRVESILCSRDYAFCLYPREHFETLLHGGLEWN